jgi:hypothetical protein
MFFAFPDQMVNFDKVMTITKHATEDNKFYVVLMMVNNERIFLNVDSKEHLDTLYFQIGKVLVGVKEDEKI